MIPNIVNTVIGIVLVYAAVLRPALIESSYALFIAGVIVIVLTILGRSSTHGQWFAQTNIALGAALVALAVLRMAELTPSLALFWGAFWVGLVVAVVALWAVLYRPSSAVQGEA
jgi:hypothetical protein